MKNAANLSNEIKAKLLKTLKLMSEDIKHPSLQSKRVKGARGNVFECRVDKDIRLIYDCNNDSLRCWYVGEHDVALKFAAMSIGVGKYQVDDIEFRDSASAIDESIESLFMIKNKHRLIEMDIDSIEKLI